MGKGLPVDSFYLVKCKWPESIHIETLQDSAWQVQAIMQPYRDCYVRHNGLVEVLQHGN